MKTTILAAALAIAMSGSAVTAAPANQQGVTTQTFIFTDVNGVQWQQTRTDTWTLTYVQLAGTAPASTPLPAPTTPATPSPTPTLTPTPAPAPSPSVPTPTITEFRDATRQFAISSVAGGAAFAIDGANFGSTRGTLMVSGTALTVTTWTDTYIIAVAPPYVAGQSPQMWTLTRADGNSSAGYHTFLGPPITAPSSP